jgi:hypothetical protein
MCRSSPIRVLPALQKIVCVLLGLAAVATTSGFAEARDGCGSGYYFNGHRCRPMARHRDQPERLRRAKPNRRTPTETAFAAVKAELRDRDVTFDRVRVESGVVCGMVEAKNARGDNSGQMLFVYVGSEEKAYVLDPTSDAPQDRVNAAIGASQQNCQH